MSLKDHQSVQSYWWYVLKIGTSVSAAPIPQTHKHVHNVQIQRWSCFV